MEWGLDLKGDVGCSQETGRVEVEQRGRWRV